jgi:hypothetical protein
VTGPRDGAPVRAEVEVLRDTTYPNFRWIVEELPDGGKMLVLLLRNGEVARYPFAGEAARDLAGRLVGVHLAREVPGG